MVVTRSQQGDERSEPGPEGNAIERAPRVIRAPEQRDASVARPPVLDAFLSVPSNAAASAAASGAAAAASGEPPRESRDPSVTTASRERGSASSNTLSPGGTRSVRSSSSSRRRLLEELDVKEKMAESKKKQAQAEEELQKIRLQRLQLQEETEESEDDDNEEELESVRIQEWIKRTPLKNNVEQPPPGDEEGKMQAVAEPQRHEENVKNGKNEETRDQEEEKKTGGIARRSRPAVDAADLTAIVTHAARSAREPPRYIQELPYYNGNCQEWLAFKAAYEGTSQFFTDTENLARIRRSLRGAAKETVGSELLGQPAPSAIIEALERRFGRPDAIVHMEVEKIKKLNKVSDNNPQELCIFASRVSNFVGTIKALRRPYLLHTHDLARTILDKLSPIYRNKWYDYFNSRRGDDTPELVKMCAFLNNEADKCGAFALPEAIPSERYEKKSFKKERAFTTKRDNAADFPCPACKEGHQLLECERFLRADINDRWEIVKKNHVCFCCLKSRHRRFTCKAAPCGQRGCRMRHHKLLHHEKGESRPLPTSVQPQEKFEAVTSAKEVAATTSENERRAYLKIIPVILSGPTTSVEVFALLDEGSTVSLIDASIADVIGADGPKRAMWLQGISSEMRHENSKTISAKIRGKYSDREYDLKAARTVERLDFSPESVRREDIRACAHLSDIIEEITYERASPKILLGQDSWELIVSRELRVGKKNQPVASYTQLGWVLHGCQNSHTGTAAFCGNIRQLKKKEEDIEELVKQHFKLESLGIEPRKPKDDPEERALQILKKESKRLPDGRFETAMLWREEGIAIPNNYTQAERRLHSLEKKLDKDEELKIKYHERIENLLKSGYAEPASSSPTPGRTWYLPHFPVVNPAKPHKPPRLVHDAASKYEGVSLNDMLLSGPDLLQSLPGVIMRFRQYPHAVSADLKEMFMQIKVRKEDRDALRFLWRGDRREGPPDEYRMTSVIFGATSSPCTALYIKNRNVEDFKQKYPQAAEAIEKCHYMDDYLQSFKNIEETIAVASAVDHVHRKGGFELSGWTSNSEKVRRTLCKQQENNSAKAIGGNATEKALGLHWDVDGDYFCFRINRLKTPTDIIESERRPTKREALSIIMALFDPLGLISPMLTPAKRIFQDTWRYKIDWNDPLPEELLPRWRRWVGTLLTIEKLKIPRCYDYGEVSTLQLHTFVDASEEAYAAAVYWRSEHPDGSVKVTLAASKTRVTPTRPISVPRLELQAGLLGARLAKTVQEEHDYEVEKRVFWSDSRTALAWIRAEPRTFKTFVAHRLAEIEETTKKNEWRWVPTKDNVADDATRDTPADFNSQHRWFEGPSFLRLPEHQWPQEQKTEESTGDEEKKPKKCYIEEVKKEETRHPHLPNISRFSRWTRLVRATARVLQFVEKLKQRKSTETTMAARKRTKKNKETDPSWTKIRKKENSSRRHEHGGAPTMSAVYAELPADLLIEAERLWIRASQQDSFSREIKRIRNNSKPENNDRLATLTTYVDRQDIVRLRGRVAAAHDVHEEQVNPAVLDGRHPYTRLYTRHVHEKLHHGGVEMVVNELRQRVWIVKIRPTVRDVIKSCIPCRMTRKKPSTPLTGDLPAARLAHHERPFTFSGLDYFGPVEVTVARHREKRYGALFTCMTSRAIHIEVVHSLSADSCIAALRRFFARRGCPKEIWSDNATCFKAADKELAAAALEGLQHEVTTHHVTWKYIPPASPFMGGAWERMVRTVKEALKTTLHERHPSDETLATLLAEVENTVNSRPLTHVAVTPDEPEALTPNHILIGPNCHVPPPGHFSAGDTTARQQWRRAQALADDFWRRWLREYLPLLQHRRETFNADQPPKVGDFVIVCDPNSPRNTWPRGQIVQTHPGADGEVRIVDIRLSSGNVLQRPTRKIVVLPEISPSGDGGRMFTTK